MGDEVSDLIWHKHVLLKVSFLAWRLLRNRLLTKANLVAHGILAQEAQFVSRDVGVWRLLNIYLSHVPNLENFGFMFVLGFGYQLRIRMILLTIFFSLLTCQVVRLLDVPLFNFCGSCVFGCSSLNVMINILTTLKVLFLSYLKGLKDHSYWWMKVVNAVFVVGENNWMTCPLNCLGIS